MDLMREAAEDDDVSTVGLGAAVGGELYLDMTHLNEAGHELLARALFQFLIGALSPPLAYSPARPSIPAESQAVPGSLVVSAPGATRGQR